MDIKKIANEFFKFVKNDYIISIASFEDNDKFITELVNMISKYNLNVSFIPVNASQAAHFLNLNQKTISLSDREIDLAIMYIDEIDQYNNFIKRKTTSFIRDKMIAQSALNLVVVVNKDNVVNELSNDVCVEISTFAWQRTIINLQSYGVARIVLDTYGNYIKTETGHYLARITLDKNITLDDFEYSVRNIPGVLETGVFIGLADTIFMVDSQKNSIFIKGVSEK